MRGIMLTDEALSHLSDLEREIPTSVQLAPGSSNLGQSSVPERTIDSEMYSLGHALDSIIELHREWPQPVDRFSGTVERAARQGRELQSAGLDPRATAELKSRSRALGFTLFQLDRLHSIAAGELLSRIEVVARRGCSASSWR